MACRRSGRAHGLNVLQEASSSGADVEKQDRDRDQQRAAPGEHLPIGVGAHRELEDHDRQIGHRRVEVGAPELVVERGEQQRRRLAGDARDREHDAGHHALHRRAVGDHHDHLPLRRAERRRRLAQRVRHQAQHVLGGAHDDRDDDDRQRHRPGPGREMAHVDDHHLIDEEPDDDRRRAQQDVVDKAHDFAKAAAPAYSARKVPARMPVGVPIKVAIRVITTLPKIAFSKPAGAAGRRRHLAEQRRGDRGDAVPQQGPQHEDEPQQRRTRSRRPTGS